NSGMTARRNKAKESLGEFARRVVRRNLRHFSQEENAVLRDKDPEPLHQMRVGMRRMRAAIETFGFAIRLPNEANDQAISKISRRLGEVRDLDVLLAKLGQLEGLDPQILRTLAARREEHFEGLRQTLRGRRYEALTNSLREWTKRPVFRTAAELPLRPALPDLLDRSLAEPIQQKVNRALAVFFDDYDALLGVRTRRSGRIAHVEITIGFAPKRTMGEVSHVLARMEDQLKRDIPDIDAVLIARALP
ncbi:MAG: hypothetical protein B7X34_08565, partial [Acidobacteriia bacterium 12-62-4]